jgi:hypothetical protein
VLNKQILAVDKKWVTQSSIVELTTRGRYDMSQKDGVWSDYFMLHSLLSFGVHIDGLPGCTMAWNVLMR